MANRGPAVIVFLAIGLGLLIAPAKPALAADGIPALSMWERQMVTLGKRHCGNLEKIKDGPIDPALGAIYYDAMWIYYQIARYTNETDWNKCAQVARHVYRDRYVAPNNAAVPGYWNFTSGLRADWERTGDTESKEWAIKLSQRAAYANDAAEYGWASRATVSREIAYSIISYINAEALGAPKRAQRATYVDLSYGYLDQWFVKQSWRDTPDQMSPFMVALTAMALIRDWEETKDPRLLPALKRAADYLWQDAWVAGDGGMRYQLNPKNVTDGGRSPRGGPDLNLLVAPMYAWLWVHTGDGKYRDAGDALFAAGIKGAWLDGAKQFNQSYFWSFDFVKWRQTVPRP